MMLLFLLIVRPMRTFKKKSELVELLSTPIKGTMSLTSIILSYQVKINGSVAFIELHDGVQLSFLPYQTLYALVRLVWTSFNYQYTFHVHWVDVLLSSSEHPMAYVTIDDANHPL